MEGSEEKQNQNRRGLCFFLFFSPCLTLISTGQCEQNSNGRMQRVTDVKGRKRGKRGNYDETTVSATEETEEKVNMFCFFSHAAKWDHRTLAYVKRTDGGGRRKEEGAKERRHPKLALCDCEPKVI